MVKKSENIIVGISIGDLNGIGSEVVMKTLEDNRMLELCTPVIFANVKIMTFLKKTYNLTLNFHGIDNLNQLVIGKINVLNVWKESVNIQFGVNDNVVGEFAIKSFIAATKALKDNLIDVLVTAPINKYSIQSEDFKFPGHTDYLAKQFNERALMFMINNDLRVGLLTDHVPVNDVAKHLTEDLIVSKVNLINQSLKQDFGISKPKIAVLGLNPHCGDNGVIGKEDDQVLKPALLKIFEKGTLVFGPFSADSFFGSKQYMQYDAILATYHDQGLIPFKTLSFGNGVNFTAGISKVRTSPDHGTAFDIAGKGIANEESFREALYQAIDIYNNRIMYGELTNNPLIVSKR
ncbi:4-hydroxythreonine-4-phosphate dehydrogenase PdxA [Flavobacterium sp.]|uniref:4-hydroxythreonine-4-phosphate dehydrogenase PdxA n=1 Tax=Flavobacterium sp. TaxID=239 RepID=UPI003F69F12E